MSSRKRPGARTARGAILLKQAVLGALENMKAVNVRVLDVRGLTDFVDTMIVASGNSDRHVRSIAERVVEAARALDRRPLGTEGIRDGEWALVDLQDMLVHVMLPRVREFYGLEHLWEAPARPKKPAAARRPSARSARSGAPRRRSRT
ncbi:MAG: ribosome silencing factor [Proteobacteria bacterium]|nr:ribosome silencing factor [Pseudomonadota bacterium]